MRSTVAALSLVFVGLVTASAACGSDKGDSQFGSSGGAGKTTDGAELGGTSFGDGDGSVSTSHGGDGGAEICDGIDNDGDGIIDNVDVGNDGICDCLRVATLGKKGQWGEGDVFASWLDSRSVKGAVDLSDQVLTRELLEPYQVIVAQNLSVVGRTYSTDEVKALGDWIKAGGGFLTLIGYGDPPERTNVNMLLQPFDLRYKAAQILSKQGGSTIPIRQWTSHAVTQGITKIGVDNGYEVEGTGTTLATEQGFVMLKAREAEKGHILVWGDEWITYNSEWKDHPDYQVEHLWLNMIKWLTPAGECQVPIPSTVH